MEPESRGQVVGAISTKMKALRLLDVLKAHFPYLGTVVYIVIQ